MEGGLSEADESFNTNPFEQIAPVDPVEPPESPEPPEPPEPPESLELTQPVASYQLGAEVYGNICSNCHQPLQMTVKANRSRLSIEAALSVIPQMQFFQLSDVELDSVVIALSGVKEVASCEAVTFAPRLNRLSPSQYDNTLSTFIPDIEDSPSDGFATSLARGRFSSDTSVLSMSAPHISQLMNVSEEVAELLANKPESLVECAADNGVFGEVVASGSGSPSKTTIDIDRVNARYIRIDQLSLGNAAWGIADLIVYNEGVALNRSNWVVEASDNLADPELAIDLDDTTRWATDANQSGGEWFTIDLGSMQNFDQIYFKQLLTNPSSWPRSYEVRVAQGPFNSSMGEQECTDVFIGELLTRAFRRPVESTDVELFRAFYDRSLTDFTETEALKLMIQRVLLAPEFLFRTELGAEDSLLNSYELASAVSYLISDGPPDSELYATAADNTLHDAGVLIGQAERLLAQRSTGAGVESFFRENLTYEQVRGIAKDESLFPGFDESVANAMATETQEFIAHVLWNDDASLSTLLSAPYSLLNEDLEDVYGLSDLGPDFARVELDENRGGILTQPSFLARFASFDESDIVHRGLYVAEELLCRVVPEPPDGVADSIVNIDTSTPITQRQIIEQHTGDPLCASCHLVFDDFGTALENFDAVGGYRNELRAFSFDGGNPDSLLPIDISVDILNVGSVSSSLGLIEGVANSNEARACFAERLTEYIYGGKSDVATCEQAPLVESLEASGDDMKAAILRLITSPNFQQRTPRDQE